MANVPLPPALQLPQISFSAPASRLRTPPPPPGKRGRRAASLPVSPISKKVPSPIAKKLLAPVLSPTRGLRKHRYHATFAQHNPRTTAGDVAACPSHAYASLQAELDLLPKGRTRGPASFATFNPRTVEAEAACPVHAYASVEQELSVLPSTAVGGVKFGGTPRLTPARANCPVHVYAAAKSTLSHMGAASFGTERRLVAAAPGSSVRRTGASAALLPAIERAPEKVALPKLAPLPEAGRKVESEEDDDSPRGVEAVLA